MHDPDPHMVNLDWEQQAANWIAWARAPQHDPYWYYRDAFFEMLPPRARRSSIMPPRRSGS